MGWFKAFGGGLKLRVRRGDEEFGVFGIAEFKDWVDRGVLDPSDEVCFVGTEQWVPLSEIKIHGTQFNLGAHAPAPTHSTAAPRRRFKSAALFFGAPLALAGGGGGGALLAIFIVVVFVWGTIDMNRSGAREQATEALRNRIARHVDAHPDFSATSSEDIVNLPIVTDEDRKLIRSAEITVYPVDANSPDEALVLTRPTNGGERRYYLRCPTNFVASWNDPNKRFRVISEPESPSNRVRIVRIETTAGAALAEYRVEAHTVFARWRSDGRFVAINESRPEGRHRMAVYEVTAAPAALELAIPDQIQPRHHVRQEDAARGELRWTSDQIVPIQWLDTGELQAESYGHVVVIDAERMPIRYVTFRTQYTLAADVENSMRVVQSRPVNYESSVPSGTIRPLPPLTPMPAHSVERQRSE